eukprot:CAMPEP_0184344838 /NCGR_PEP_ID=MMETSP1089-20130417/13306_1 /TAXON_ID=38269 ORGANISM="Gloeochaete wittrockiana, Strain SAG46.84" /NCGR_SAMPLE_ID=MMETSP1089 /ASSEMBLY_ACC=CAM_ASM_000445 /LENGTH=666 /DNA_ID=CAMNT_0026674879 /DNA_START=238 /DNA_END=2238 /DNA_ORIENTATION=+
MAHLTRNPFFEPYGSIVTQGHLEEIRILLSDAIQRQQDSAVDELIDMLHGDGETVKALVFMAKHEIASFKQEILFREESPFTHALQKALLIDHQHRTFLRQVIYDAVVEPILSGSVGIDIELDINRASSVEQVEASREAITILIARLFDNIRQYKNASSLVIVKLLKQMQDSVSHDMWNTTFANIFFLRNICSHIIDPRKVLLTRPSETISREQTRSLILVCKVVQNIASGVAFDGSKEPYMQIMNEFIRKYIHFSTTYQIFDHLVDPKNDLDRIGVECVAVRGRKPSFDRFIRRHVRSNLKHLAPLYDASPVLKSLPLFSWSASQLLCFLSSRDAETPDDIGKVLTSLHKKNTHGLDLYRCKSAADLAKRFDIKVHGNAMKLFRFVRPFLSFPLSSAPIFSSSSNTPSPTSLEDRSPRNSNPTFSPALTPLSLSSFASTSASGLPSPNLSSSSSSSSSIANRKSRSLTNILVNAVITPPVVHSSATSSVSSSDSEEDFSFDSTTSSSTSSTTSNKDTNEGTNFDTARLIDAFQFILKKVPLRLKPIDYGFKVVYIPVENAKDGRTSYRCISTDQLANSGTVDALTQVFNIHSHSIASWSPFDLQRWTLANGIEDLFTTLAGSVDPFTLFNMSDREELRSIGVDKIGPQKRLFRLMSQARAASSAV